jgi:NHL repeat
VTVTALSSFQRVAGFGVVSLSMLLASCNGGAGASLAPTPASFNHLGAYTSSRKPSKSWISPAAKTTPLLYVSDGAEDYVFIYPANVKNPTPIGQLTGFDIAAGLAVDKAGNLYVADTVDEQVQVFQRGSTSPFERLNAHGYAYGEAVDDSGNVYVAVGVTGSQQGFVAIYPPGATEPTSMLTDPSRGFSPVSVALDSQNDVFVAYDSALNTGPGNIDEFKAGSTKPTHLGIKTPKKLGVGWMAIDQGGNLIVPDGSKVHVYPQGSKEPSLTFGGSKKNAPTSVALNHAGSLVYVAENGATQPHVNAVRVYTYPGAKLVETISQGLTAGNPIDALLGVAVDPRSSP